MNIKLLPCPFCGGTAILSGLMEYSVECRDCHCQTIRTSSANAIALWNARRIITANAENMEGVIENGYSKLSKAGNEDKSGGA